MIFVSAWGQQFLGATCIVNLQFPFDLFLFVWFSFPFDLFLGFLLFHLHFQYFLGLPTPLLSLVPLKGGRVGKQLKGVGKHFKEGGNTFKRGWGDI